MTKVKIGAGAVLVVALIGGIAYLIITGRLKWPDLGGFFRGDVIRGAAEGAKVGGVPGAVGGAIYNIFRTGDETLGEQIPPRYRELLLTTPTEIKDPLQIAPDQGLTEPQIWKKAGIEVAAEELLYDKGIFGVGPYLFPPLAGITIGSGIAIIQQHGEYLETLPPERYREARYQEYEQREAWMTVHPVESIIGAPAVIYHAATKPSGLDLPERQLIQKAYDLELELKQMGETTLLTQFGKAQVTEKIEAYHGEITRRIEVGEIPGLPQPIVQAPTAQEFMRSVSERFQQVREPSPVVEPAPAAGGARQAMQDALEKIRRGFS